MIKWRKTESFNFLPPESKDLETTNGFPYQWSICSYRMSALFFDFAIQKKYAVEKDPEKMKGCFNDVSKN